MPDDESSIWSRLKPSSFEVQGRPRVVVPVWNRIEGSHGIRAVSRAIPWVNGEQLDETGTTAKEWSTEHPFINDLHQGEPALGDTPILYPDRMELFEAILELRKTGTLHLPWRRNIRCKAISWRRTATVEQQDCETLVVQWKEDNENKLENPSVGAGVRANIKYVVEQARFEAERAGIWDGSWEDITLLASQLEAAVAAPGLFLEDIGQKANRVVRACDSIIESHSKATDGRNVLLDPAGFLVFRALTNLRNLASTAESEARGTRRTVVTKAAPFDGSIWQFAMLPDWNAEPEQLLRDNPQIEDPNWILKGTGLKVAVLV